VPRLPEPVPSDQQLQERLDSWKEIASFLERDVRTVQRWEKAESLPVHRHRHSKLDSVYAFKGELLAWQESRKRNRVAPPPVVENEPEAAKSADDLNLITSFEVSSAAPVPSFEKPFGGQLLGLSVTLLTILVGAYLLLRSSAHPEKRVHTGLGATPLTAYLGEESSPSFSPDGQRVAFVWNGPSRDNYDIYIKGIETSDALRLTASADIDYSPAWSPDGKWIAFCRGTANAGGALWIVPATGGPERKVINLYDIAVPGARSLSWSPDSRFLVSDTKPQPNGNGLFLINVATGAWSLLTTPNPGENDVAPAVSPDGKNLAFVRDTGRGISTVRVAPFHTDGATLPDGKQLSWSDSAHLVVSNPAWTPDSEQVVFDSNQGGDSHLWVMPVHRTEKPTLLPYGSGVQKPAISRQGQLAFEHFILNANIWKLDLQALLSGGTAAPVQVLASTRIQDSPTVSPDGKSIAFASNRAGYMEVWTSTAEGANVAALTSMKVPITGSPSWSPDGASIAFDSRLGVKPQLFRIPASGGKPVVLTDGRQADVVPRFSPDGKWIYFSSNRTGAMQLWRMRPNGAGTEQVTHNGGFAPVFSPDGAWIYYGRQNTTVTSLWRMNLNTREEEQLVPSIQNRSFAIAGSGLVYISNSAGKSSLFFLDPSSNASRLLFTFDRQIWLGTALSPNGRDFFYSQVDEQSQDLQLVQDFWR
jgi:Tol biopolymer transport system component